MDSGSSSSDEVESEYKVIVLGDSAVGKTSLIRRYCEDSFDQSYKQTIGLDFYSKKVEIPGSRSVTLQILDIGGQQIGGSMIANYIHGARTICFVYDVTNPTSFNHLEEWHKCVLAVLEKNKGAPRPFMVLIGTKTDLPNRQISTEAHEKAADFYKMHPLLISARSGDRINALFTMIAANLAGVEISQGELDMINRVVANIESKPGETMPVFQSTEAKSKKSDDNKNCVLM